MVLVLYLMQFINKKSFGLILLSILLNIFFMIGCQQRKLELQKNDKKVSLDSIILNKHRYIGKPIYLLIDDLNQKLDSFFFIEYLFNSTMDAARLDYFKDSLTILSVGIKINQKQSNYCNSIRYLKYDNYYNLQSSVDYSKFSKDILSDYEFFEVPIDLYINNNFENWYNRERKLYDKIMNPLDSIINYKKDHIKLQAK